MNIKDSYIHNGTAVLKDVKVENSVLKKILAGKDANDAYLGWETVCDLTGIKPKAAGTADKVEHKLTFSGGVTGTWDGSADKTVTIPTKSSWNYDDVYLKLTGNGTTNPLTGTIYIKDVNGIIINSKDKDLNIWEVYGNSGVWASQYGFNLQYLGTGSGNNNDLVLWAHNQAGTHVETYRVKQDGTFIFKAAPKVGTNVMYHAGNLTIKTLMGTTAIGDSDEPVYWNGSSFVKAGAYPTKASWNYDDRYLKLAGGTMSNTNIVTNLNADLLDGYHASSFYQNKTLRSDQDSIYDLRFNYGQYDKGDFSGTYKDEYPTYYGSYIALTARDKNIGALMFFDTPTSNILGHIYVKTRGAGDSNITYSEWGTLAYLTDNVASASKWATARTITLTGSVTGSVSIDGSQNVSLATTTHHTHTFASLTDKPTTIGGYGITDGLRRVTLANNVENDFNTFENLTLTGRGDPTTGSSLLNSPWTTQPAGGFGVLTYLWSGYGLQLAAGYHSNDLYIRNKYYTGGGSNWDTRWDRILNSSNFNSYAPTLTGTGATGTWGISISGNAKTATTSTYASNVGSSGTAGTNYVTAANVISMYNWYNSITATDDASNTAIDKWNEIVSFLTGITDTSTLSGILAGYAASGHNHDDRYLKLSGGTITGVLHLFGSKYEDSANTGALDLANSDIYGVNSIKFADLAESAGEGLQWYRDATHVDSLWVNSGIIYFSPNRTWGGTVTNYTVLHSGNLTPKTITLSTTAQTYITSAGTSYTIKMPNTDPYTSARTPKAHTHYATTYKDSRNEAMTPTQGVAVNGIAIDFKTKANGVGAGSGIYCGLITFDPYSDVSGGYPMQIGFNTGVDSTNTNEVYIRTAKDANTWNTWRTIIHDLNYTSYTVKKDGTGASGTWGISITGTAGSVAWGNVTGKPTNYVTTDTTQTITGEKTFATNILTVSNPNGGDATLKFDRGSNTAWSIVDTGGNLKFNELFSSTTRLTLFESSQGGYAKFAGSIYSTGFVKNRSSDNYILLGGGGHKAISDFAAVSTLNNYVLKKPDTHFYNYIGCNKLRNWYKITLPFHNTTSTNNRWMMVSMELILKGNYSSGADGTIYLSYYIYYPANNNVGIADKVYAVAIGSNMNNVRIAYNKADLGIFYVYVPNLYNSFAIQNLSANDNAPNYDFTTTTIDALASSAYPADSEIQDINIRKLYTTDGTSLMLNGNVLIDAGNIGSQSVSNARNLLGRTTTGSDYGAVDGNLVFAEWSTYSDNRWYLKAKGYETRVGYANNSDKLDGQDLITQVSDWNTDSLSIFKSSENSSSNAPTTDYLYGLTLRFHRDDSTYHTDLVSKLYSDALFFRRKTEGGYGSWRELIHSGNIGSQSVSYASSAGNADTLDNMHASTLLHLDGYYYIPGNDTNSSTKLWSKIGSITFTGAWQQCGASLTFYEWEARYMMGELKFNIRTSSSKSNASADIVWMNLTNKKFENSFIICRTGNGTYDIYFEYPAISYINIKFYIISQYDNGYITWQNGSALTSIEPTYINEKFVSSLSSWVGNANYATSAGSVAWSNVTGKPATAIRWPSWNEVTDKPTFTTWSETSSAASYSLSNAAWTNTITLPTTAGSYILNIVSGNSTLTGVFSIGASDNAKDEISLHLHGNGPRLYARTNGTTLQLSSNDASATSRSVTIKYRRMI